MASKAQPQSQGTTSLRQKELEERKAAEAIEIRGSCWAHGTLLAMKSADSSSGFFIVQVKETQDKDAISGTATFKATLWAQTASCRYLATKPPQEVDVNPKDVIRPVVLEGRYLPTKTLEWIFGHKGAPHGFNEDDSSSDEDDDESSDDDAPNSGGGENDVEGETDVSAGSDEDFSRGKRSRTATKKKAALVKKKAASKTPRTVGAKAPRAKSPKKSRSGAPPAKKARKEKVVPSPEELLSQRTDKISKLLKNARTKKLQRGAYLSIRCDRAQAAKTWACVPCAHCNSTAAPRRERRRTDEEPDVAFDHSYLALHVGGDNVGALYHRDCLFPAIQQSAAEVKWYLAECKTIKDQVNAEIDQLGYSYYRRKEKDLLRAENKWWAQQSKRADQAGTVIVDWFSDTWGWAKGWMGSTQRQHHLVFKKEALAWAALLQNYGESDYQLPPVALGLSFYRCLSSVRMRECKKIDPFNAQDYPAASRTERHWGGGFGAGGFGRSSVQYTHEFSLGSVFNVRKHKFFGKIDTHRSLYSFLKNEVWKQSNDWILSTLAQFGQVDILRWYLSQDLGWTTDEAVGFLKGLIQPSTRCEVSALATVKLLLDKFLYYSKDSTDKVNHQKLLLSPLMSSQNPDLVELALEKWPTMETELLVRPFGGDAFNLECCQRVMDHENAALVDWANVCPDFVYAVTGREQLHGRYRDKKASKLIFNQQTWALLLKALQFMTKKGDVNTQARHLVDTMEFWAEHCPNSPEALEMFTLLCSKCNQLDSPCSLGHHYRKKAPAPTRPHNANDATPLCAALLYPTTTVEMVKALVGANIEERKVGCSINHREPAHRNGGTVYLHKKVKFTPLQFLVEPRMHWETWPIWEDVVRVVLEAGASPNYVVEETADGPNGKKAKKPTRWQGTTHDTAPIVTLIRQSTNLATESAFKMFLDHGADTTLPELAVLLAIAQRISEAGKA